MISHFWFPVEGSRDYVAFVKQSHQGHGERKGLIDRSYDREM